MEKCDGETNDDGKRLRGSGLKKTSKPLNVFSFTLASNSRNAIQHEGKIEERKERKISSFSREISDRAAITF